MRSDRPDAADGSRLRREPAPMFNSTILDVAVGLAFTFFAVSLVCSALVEAISSFLQWRSSGLLKGVQQLVNDEAFAGLARRLYEHAAVNPRGTIGTPVSTMPNLLRPFMRSEIVITPAPASPRGAAAGAAPAPVPVSLVRPPAYIDKRQFAAALMDILALSRHGSETYADARAAAGAMLADLHVSPLLAGNPQIATLLGGAIERGRGDVAAVQAELAAWFDNAMDRVSGAYKRRTQLVAFLIAVALAGLLNLDCIGIGRALWHQPALADALHLSPEMQVKLAAPDAATDPAARQRLEEAAATAALAVLDSHLAIGWEHLDTGKLRWDGWLALVAGWLLTSVATLFGAPFWFDALQSFVHLKGAGPSPDDRASSTGAKG